MRSTRRAPSGRRAHPTVKAPGRAHSLEARSDSRSRYAPHSPAGSGGPTSDSIASWRLNCPKESHCYAAVELGADKFSVASTAASKL
ncbi:hypothetical protein LA080_000699 [Diaporthe eres]|nr:hypothetical protein LA080_000699 [Diaporthe eres]